MIGAYPHLYSSSSKFSISNTHIKECLTTVNLFFGNGNVPHLVMNSSHVIDFTRTSPLPILGKSLSFVVHIS